MIKHALATAFVGSSILLFSISVAATGTLENPQPGGLEAGIAVISGWHCTSRNIEVRIDGVSLGLAGAGTSRGDTMSVCGRTDTGFSLLYNYNLLQGGTHRVDVYADGVLFGSSTFQVGYLGAEFLAGLSAAHTIPNFPGPRQGTRVQWEQSKQNFVVSGAQPLTSPSIVGTYTITEVWYQDSTGLFVTTWAPGTSASGTETFNADGTWSLNFSFTVNMQTSSSSGSGTYIDGGYYLQTGGSEINLLIERGDTLTFFTAGPVSATTTAAFVISAVRSQTAAAEKVEAAAAGAPAGATAGGLLHTIQTAVRSGAN